MVASVVVVAMLGVDAPTLPRKVQQHTQDHRTLHYPRIHRIHSLVVRVRDLQKITRLF